jgi:hypothetical protein
LDQKFLSQGFAPMNTDTEQLSKPDLKCFHSNGTAGPSRTPKRRKLIGRKEAMKYGNIDTLGGM